MAAPDDAKLDLIARLQQLPMRHRWLRWAVLAASLAFSAGSTYYFSIQMRQEARSRSGERNLGRITISAGVALYPEDGEDIETLLQAADIALYEAKHSGRDRLVVYQGISGGAKPKTVVMDTRDLKPEK